MHPGAANWRITDGRTVILLDPYYSRLRFTGKTHGLSHSPTVAGYTRAVFGPDNALVSDTSTLDVHAARANQYGLNNRWEPVTLTSA